jgi:hypothetical protein
VHPCSTLHEEEPRRGCSSFVHSRGHACARVVYIIEYGSSLTEWKLPHKSWVRGGPDRTRWSTHSGSSRRMMVLTVRVGTEGQQWERSIYARLPRGPVWAGGRDHTPSRVPPAVERQLHLHHSHSRVPQRRGTTSCREAAPLTDWVLRTCCFCTRRMLVLTKLLARRACSSSCTSLARATSSSTRPARGRWRRRFSSSSIVSSSMFSFCPSPPRATVSAHAGNRASPLQTGRERMGWPTLQTLQEPILLLRWVWF